MSGQAFTWLAPCRVETTTNDAGILAPRSETGRRMAQNKTKNKGFRIRELQGCQPPFENG
jgi:hypothetical protein